jgi:hypothetical protein
VLRKKKPQLAGLEWPLTLGFAGGQGQNRTADPRFFRPVLYQLSYLAECTLWGADIEPLAGTTGFEPATSGLTGRRELQASPRPQGGCSPFGSRRTG